MITGYFLTLLFLWVIGLSNYLVLCIKNENFFSLYEFGQVFSREIKYEPAEIIGGTLAMSCGIGLMHWGLIEAAITYPKGAIGAGLAIATITIVGVVLYKMRNVEVQNEE